MDKEVLQKALTLIGADVKFEGLMKKSGRLRSGCAQNVEDVLGFDYLLHHENTCYEYYAANPPLIGMTQPVPVECPLGMEIFDEYEIDYKKAIDIFHSGNWGSGFISIVLCKPLVYPQATEPNWYFKSNTGVQVVIGADSGKIIYPQ